MSGRESRQGGDYEGDVRDALLVEFLGELRTAQPMPELGLSPDSFDPVVTFREQLRTLLSDGRNHDVDLVAETKHAARRWFSCKSGNGGPGQPDVRVDLAKMNLGWELRKKSGTDQRHDRYVIVIPALTEPWRKLQRALETIASGDDSGWPKVQAWFSKVEELRKIDEERQREFAMHLRILTIPWDLNTTLQRIASLPLARFGVSPQQLLDGLRSEVTASHGAIPPIRIDDLRRNLAERGLTYDVSIEEERFVAEVREDSETRRPDVGLASDHPEWTIDRTQEVERLEAEASAGHVVVFGESGSGKSWLIDRWRATLEKENRAKDLVLVDAAEFDSPRIRSRWDGDLPKKLGWIRKDGARFLVLDALDEFGAPDSEPARLAKRLIDGVRRCEGLQLVAIHRAKDLGSLASPFLTSIQPFAISPLDEDSVRAFARDNPMAGVESLALPGNEELLRLATRPFLLRLLVHMARSGNHTTARPSQRRMTPEDLLQDFWTWLSGRISQAAVKVASVIALSMWKSKRIDMSRGDKPLDGMEREIGDLESHGVLRGGQDFVRFSNAAHREFAIAIAIVRGSALEKDLAELGRSADALTRIGVMRALATRILAEETPKRAELLAHLLAVPSDLVPQIAEALARAADVTTIEAVVQAMIGRAEPNRSNWLEEFTNARAIRVENGSIEPEANRLLVETLVEVSAPISVSVIARLFDSLRRAGIGISRWSEFRPTLVKLVDRWSDGIAISQPRGVRTTLTHLMALAWADDTGEFHSFVARVRHDPGAADGLLDAARALVRTRPRLSAHVLEQVGAILGKSNAAGSVWHLEPVAHDAFDADPIAVTRGVIAFVRAAPGDQVKGKFRQLTTALGGKWKDALKEPRSDGLAAALIRVLESHATSSEPFTELLWELVHSLNQSPHAAALRDSPMLRDLVDPATSWMEIRRFAAGNFRSVGFDEERFRKIIDSNRGIVDTDLERATRSDRSSLTGSDPKTREPNESARLRSRLLSAIEHSTEPMDAPLRFVIEEELAEDAANDLERDEAPSPTTRSWIESVLPRFVASEHATTRAAAARVVCLLSHFEEVREPLGSLADSLASDDDDSVLTAFARLLPLAGRIPANASWLWRHVHQLTDRALNEDRRDLLILVVMRLEEIGGIDVHGHSERWLTFLRTYSPRVLERPRSRATRDPRDEWFWVFFDWLIVTDDRELRRVVDEVIARRDPNDFESMIGVTCEILRTPRPGANPIGEPHKSTAKSWLRSIVRAATESTDDRLVSSVVRASAAGLCCGVRFDGATCADFLHLVDRLPESDSDSKQSIGYAVQSIVDVDGSELDFALSLLERAFLRESSFIVPANAAISGLLDSIEFALESITDTRTTDPTLDDRRTRLLDAAYRARVPSAAELLDRVRARSRD